MPQEKLELTCVAGPPQSLQNAVFNNETQDAMKGERCSILMISCDAYMDTWSPFFDLFRRFWPDCPYPIYHLTNELSFKSDGVQPILVGPDRSWSDNLLVGLAEIQTPLVLMMLDDLFLVEQVATQTVVDVINWFSAAGGNYLRLNGFPKPEIRIDHKVGEITPGSAYRASTVLTVWRRDVLMSVLRSGENAWEFEIDGSVRSDALNGFYSTRHQLLRVENTIIKGKWRKSSLQRLQRLGIFIDSHRRPITTRSQDFVISLRTAASRAPYFLPSAWRRPLQALLRRKTSLSATGTRTTQLLTRKQK